MKKIIMRLVRGLLYGAMVAPLVVLPAHFTYPFVVPRVLFLQSTILASAALAALLFWRKKHIFAFKHDAIGIALLCYCVLSIVSAAIGVDSARSIWSTQEDMLGVLTTIYFIVFYFVAVTVFPDFLQWQKVVRFCLYVSIPVLFIGGIQIVSPTFFYNQESGRIGSTIGNSLYFASYLLFVIAAGALATVQATSKRWRISAVVLVVIAGIELLFTGSRGAFISALTTLLGALICITVIKKKLNRLLVLLWGLVACVVLFLVFATRFPLVRNAVPILDRLDTTSIAQEMASPRFLVFKIAWHSWLQKPMFGWGPANFYAAFNKNYDPKLLAFGSGETWYGNAHNIVLTHLVEGGLVGTVSYVAIFIVVFVMILRAYRAHRISAAVAILLCAYPFAQFVQNLTFFETPLSFFCLMIWFVAVSLAAKKSDNRLYETIPEANYISAVMVIVTLIIVSVIARFTIWPIALSNVKALSITRQMRDGLLTPQAVLSTVSYGVSPYDDELARDMVRAILEYQGPQSGLPVADARAFFKELETMVHSRGIAAHPLDILNYLTYNDIEESAYAALGDPAFLESGRAQLQKAKELSPRRQEIHYSLATGFLQQGRAPEAVALLENTQSENQSIPQTYWRLSLAYLVNGEPNKALAVLDEARQKNMYFSDDEKNTIAQIITQANGLIAKKP